MEIEEIQKALNKYAYNLCRNTYDRDDLVQQTNLAILETWGKYPKSDTRKVAIRTMRNIYINQYNRETKFPNVDLDCQDGYVPNYGDPILLDIIHSKIKGLDDIHSSPFLLMCEGYSYQELSDMASVPLNTIKSRIFQARKHLMAELKPILLEYPKYSEA